jgi:hypothetical protein
MSRQLPPDLLPILVEHLQSCTTGTDYAALAALALVNHAGAAAAAKALYSRVIVRPPNSLLSAGQVSITLGLKSMKRTDLTQIVEDDEEEEEEEDGERKVKLDRVVCHGLGSCPPALHLRRLTLGRHSLKKPAWLRSSILPHNAPYVEYLEIGGKSSFVLITLTFS